MAIAQTLVPQFDFEMAGTRKVLALVPDEKLEWKAHPTLNSIGWVAAHLADIPNWARLTVQTDSLDIRPVGGEPYRTPKLGSRDEILTAFDRNVAEARAALANASDECLLGNWSLQAAGETTMTMPRIAVIRGFVISHSIHHRAHLCVYLRLNDIQVPGLYGPSGGGSL